MSKRIMFRPGEDQIGLIQDHGFSDIKVGPDNGGSYRYKIGPYFSAEKYHNSVSAWFDARRPQRITFAHLLVPDLVTESDALALA